MNMMTKVTVTREYGVGAMEYLSEHRRRVVTFLGETVIITVKHEPIRKQYGLLPYYAIYQVVREGRLIDENDGPEQGHDSWEAAWETITALAMSEIQADHDGYGEDDTR